MTDRERFDVILEELGALLSRVGCLCDVVLIGGQALAVEQVAVGEDPLLQVETDTGQRLVRGYSFDPDLLVDSVDPEESARWDELPEILRGFGYDTSVDAENVNGRSRSARSTSGWTCSGRKVRRRRRRP